MSFRPLAVLPTLLLCLCARAGAEAQERTTDPLGPIAECISGDGFHYETKDRRPAAARTRNVNTSSGPKLVTAVDGYRMMIYRKSSAPFVNLKVEQSAEGHFANDRLVIIDQMKEVVASTKPPHRVSLETSTQNGIEILALNNPEIDYVSGVISLYTLMDEANGIVASAYLLYQRPEVREYASHAEYTGLRDRFINLLSDCMSRAAPKP